jgi:stearoyl-CoA 9-desaturase NADPH oxidoreductase
VAERGAVPKVSRVRRRTLTAVRSLFTPLLPDDYLELINPLWSTRELRGRIERIARENGDAVTITIRPGHDWTGREPGQFLRVGVVVDGVFHWRAYSLTSAPDREDGWISVTPKLVESGKVTPFLVRQARAGAIVRLGGVEGDFVLPETVPDKLLFVSAGSSITPIMSMLRALDARDELRDVAHIHSARTEDDVIFGRELRALADRYDGVRLTLWLTGEKPRLKPEDLDELCPDWREREAFLSGPGELLDAMLGENEDLELPFGCREGICHTCIGKLCEGQVRELRNGKVTGSEGEMVRTCINAPEGRIVIEL